ncbi:type II toxin-antitoxin system RelE/ParE family toxin [Dyadobacter sp. CY323]|uniref:type II toxin-antitoxin system RelE family toxin n=1 Tax=Dyadobacter sp. CY323 TaxID=2907302 RepID=UPI001F31714B|nr:type II toxin-antitoxin system RelE/ParE family toxin [Dyadobacter sp. CY323]MCE6991297.1 type II toxin-antitoxin system RelE/ParE family toxin [Dyadobacter sp. CY323]
MEVIPSKRFFKELRKCPKHIRSQAIDLIDTFENAKSIDEISDIRKMAGYKKYYRVRIGDYRVGVKFETTTIKILYVLTVQPRGDFYKTFPPD